MEHQKDLTDAFLVVCTIALEHLYFLWIFFLFIKGQVPVVRKVDNAIHWINHYPADSVVCFVNTYPLDMLSGG